MTMVERARGWKRFEAQNIGKIYTFHHVFGIEDRQKINYY